MELELERVVTKRQLSKTFENKLIEDKFDVE